VTTTTGGDTLDGMLQVANALQKAEGLIPKHYLGNPGKILAAILTGKELGIGPMEAMRSFHVVEGKPVADYSFWVSRLLKAGYSVEWKDCGPESATLLLTSPSGKQHLETWNKDRATRAGLWGRNTWKQYSETMLKARCVTSAGRSFAADVMSGCYETDEAEELQHADVRVTDEPSKIGGAAGLLAKLTNATAPAAIENPLPLTAYANDIEAHDAIKACKGIDELRAIKARCIASKFDADASEAVKTALWDRFEALKQTEPAT
jgi:hypothetical protein